MKFLNFPNLTKEGSDTNQIFAIFSLGIVTCTAGTLFTWTSPTIPIITAEDYPNRVTLEEASYLVIVPMIAAVPGSLFYSKIMDKIGRKKTLLSVALPHLAAWLIILFSDSIYLWYFSRFLYGFSDGCLFTALASYLGEICTPRIRGSWGNVITLCIYFGQIIINSIGGYCSIKVTATILLFLPIIFLVTFFKLPESPYYLIIKNDLEGARNSLQIFRGKLNVEEELSQLIQDVQRQQSEKGTWLELFQNKVHRKALCVGAFVRAAQQFTGMGAFNAYNAYFFQEAGSDIPKTISSIIFSLILTVMSMLSSVTLDKLGRRFAMTASCSGSAIILISISIYFYLKERTDLDLEVISFLPVLLMFLNLVVFSIGAGIVPSLMVSELFSTSIKAKGLCVLQVFFCCCTVTTTKIFQSFIEEFGMFSPFLFYGLVTVFSSIMCYYIVPDTSGKTLEQIQQGLKQ